MVLQFRTIDCDCLFTSYLACQVLTRLCDETEDQVGLYLFLLSKLINFMDFYIQQQVQQMFPDNTWF